MRASWSPAQPRAERQGERSEMPQRSKAGWNLSRSLRSRRGMGERLPTVPRGIGGPATEVSVRAEPQHLLTREATKLPTSWDFSLFVIPRRHTRRGVFFPRRLRPEVPTRGLLRGAS